MHAKATKEAQAKELIRNSVRTLASEDKNNAAIVMAQYACMHTVESKQSHDSGEANSGIVQDVMKDAIPRSRRKACAVAAAVASRREGHGRGPIPPRRGHAAGCWPTW